MRKRASNYNYRYEEQRRLIGLPELGSIEELVMIENFPLGHRADIARGYRALQS